MNTRTGEIRELPTGAIPLPEEVLLTKQEYETLKALPPNMRVRAYEENATKLRHAKARRRAQLARQARKRNRHR